MPSLHLSRAATRPFAIAVALIAFGGACWAQVSPQSAPIAASAPATTQAATPRQLISETIPQITDLLVDRAATAAARADRLRAILKRRIDYPTLSRIMLGAPWDGFEQKQRDEFVNVFGDYLMGVYLPLMNEYTNQQVRVTSDSPAARGDYTVVVAVTEQKGKGEQPIAGITCRMRELEREWKVIDITIDGISIGRILGAQFRPVLAKDGIDGLIKQMRDKSARGGK